jgi:hypothetical protein
MSVTSSGRSSISRMMSVTSGWFVAIALASFCSSTVLPARGGATISPRCPLPSGATMSQSRMLTSPSGRLEVQALVGVAWLEVVEADALLGRSGSSPLMRSTLSRRRYFSHSFGGRTWPTTVSPVRRSKRLICDGET